MSSTDIESDLRDAIRSIPDYPKPGIIFRDITTLLGNARAFLAVQEEFGSFDAYVWRFVGGKPIQNDWTEMAQIPAKSAEAEGLSKDLLRRGFKFVGPTICYAHMQATGMVNDHTIDCFRHQEVQQMG